MMSMVVPAQSPIFLRSLIDFLSNKSVNIEVIAIPGSELMKHGFDNIKRQLMSCLAHTIYWLSWKEKTTWTHQESKVECDQNHVFLLLLIKDEVIYSWWISFYCHFLYQTTQLISTCDNNMPLAVTALHHQEYQRMTQNLHHHHQGLWEHPSHNICQQSKNLCHSLKGLGQIQLISSCWSKVQLPLRVISWWQLWNRSQFQCIQIQNEGSGEHQWRTNLAFTSL